MPHKHNSDNAKQNRQNTRQKQSPECEDNVIMGPTEDSIKSVSPSDFSCYKHKTFLKLNLLALVLLLVSAYFTPAFSGDLECFRAWGRLGFTQELLRIYAHWKPGDIFFYPPLGMYLCAALYKITSLFGLAWPSREAILVYKLFPIAAVFIGAFIVRDIVERLRDPKSGFICGLLYAFCPALIMCSTIWGQWDSMLSLAIVGCVWAVVHKKEWMLGPLVGLALMVKLQMLFAVPILLAGSLVFLGQRKLATAIVLALVTIAIIMMPYLLIGQGSAVIKNCLGAGDIHPQPSINAFNFWLLVSGSLSILHSKNLICFDINFMVARSIGLIMWGVVLLLCTWKLYRDKSLESFIAALFITLFSAFMLLTSMHERYILPAIAVAALFSLRNAKYTSIFVATSITGTLNMLLVYLTCIGILSGAETIRLIRILISALNLGFLVLAFQTFFSSECRTLPIQQSIYSIMDLASAKEK